MLRLKEILREKGITAKELASSVRVPQKPQKGEEKKDNELGSISATAMTNIIQGNSFPRPELLKEMARVLDVDIRELFIPTKDETSEFEYRCPHCGGKLTVGKK